MVNPEISAFAGEILAASFYEERETNLKKSKLSERVEKENANEEK